MKKLLALVLCIIMVFNSCGKNDSNNGSGKIIDCNEEKNSETGNDESGKTITPKSNESSSVIVDGKTVETSKLLWDEEAEKFTSLDDPEYLDYVKDRIYSEITDTLYSDDYYIESIDVTYVSKEYIQQVAFNSQANIFFGYTLAEVESRFGDQKYVFTLGEDGTTVVKEFEDNDDTYERIIKNIAIGTGVIIVAATISAVTGGTVSLIFAASAKSGAIMALSTGGISALTTGITTACTTGDYEQALKAAALQGSEGFKIGAILGALSGGITEGIRIHKEKVAIEEFNKWLDELEVDDWVKAEKRAEFLYDGESQVSYLGGEQVDSFTPGATRPDVVRTVGDHIEAIEVKCYNLDSNASLNTLYSELERQVSDRIVNLPPGSTQRIVLDVTGKNFSKSTVDGVVSEIGKRLYDIYPDIPIDVIGAVL